MHCYPIAQAIANTMGQPGIAVIGPALAETNTTGQAQMRYLFGGFGWPTQERKEPVAPSR